MIKFIICFLLGHDYDKESIQDMRSDAWWVVYKQSYYAAWCKRCKKFKGC